MTNRNSSSINVPEARDAMDKFKAQKKKSEITEDDLKIIEKDLQKLTDDYIKEVERIADEKEKELMEI